MAQVPPKVWVSFDLLNRLCLSACRFLPLGLLCGQLLCWLVVPLASPCAIVVTLLRVPPTCLVGGSLCSTSAVAISTLSGVRSFPILVPMLIYFLVGMLLSLIGMLLTFLVGMLLTFLVGMLGTGRIQGYRIRPPVPRRIQGYPIRPPGARRVQGYPIRPPGRGRVQGYPIRPPPREEGAPVQGYPIHGSPRLGRGGSQGYPIRYPLFSPRSQRLRGYPL